MSTAKRRFTGEELETLLAQSRRNNQKVGVTGMLLSKDINFMQVVEGPEPVVDALLKKIAADPRHCGMVTLLRESITERRFADWSMGYVNADQPDHLPEGFSAIMESEDPSQFFANPTLAQKVLASFRDAL